MQLGASLAGTSMEIAASAMAGSLLQPFWAIPAVAIAGARRAMPAPDYLKDEPVVETPLDLLRHDFACYSYYPWGDRWPLMKGNERFEIALTPVLKTNSVHLLLDFGRTGGGVVYLPTMVAAPDLLERRLERVLPDYAAPPLLLSAVSLRKTGTPAATTGATSLLSRCFNRWSTLSAKTLWCSRQAVSSTPVG